MPFNKMNIFRSQQPISQQQNLFFQPLSAPGQFGVNNNSQMFGQSSLGLPTSIPRIQGNLGLNQGWGAGLQNAGGQGYATPGYPPQSIRQQQPAQMRPMPNQNLSSPRFPSQGYPLPQYAPQMHGQGYGGQLPVQPAWDEPKQGGIKGFITNIMAKFKK